MIAKLKKRGSVFAAFALLVAINVALGQNVALQARRCDAGPGYGGKMSGPWEHEACTAAYICTEYWCKCPATPDPDDYWDQACSSHINNICLGSCEM